MEKLFRDVDYYITEASNSTQREFELDFADIIEVYDTNETTITTECGRTLIINWDSKYYSYYRVIYETAQMEQHAANVNRVINILREIEVDGETMQYILDKVGMSDQMLKQLVMSQPIGEVRYMIEEREEFEEELDNQIQVRIFK
jgi:hypothetical protein